MKVHSIVDKYNLFVCQFTLCHLLSQSLRLCSYPFYVPQSHQLITRKSGQWNGTCPALSEAHVHLKQQQREHQQSQSRVLIKRN